MANKKNNVDLKEEEIIQKGEISDLLYRIYGDNNELLTPQEQRSLMYDFCDAVLNKNPYVSKDNQQTSFTIGNTSLSDALAQVDRQSKVITISEEFLRKSIIKKEIPLSKVFSVLGHEKRHITQYNNIIDAPQKHFNKLSDDNKKKVIDMVHDLNEKALTDNAVLCVFKILEEQLGKDSIEFNNLSKKEQEQVCKNFATDQYFKFAHEEDARKTGYAFANHMIDCISAEKDIDKVVRINLEKEKEHIARLKKQDDEWLAIENKNRSSVNKAIENVSIEELAQIVSNIDLKIKSLRVSKDIEEIYGEKFSSILDNVKNNANESLICAVEYISNQKTKNMSVNDHVNCLYTSLVTGYEYGLTYLSKQLKNRPDYTPGKQKEVNSKMSKMFIDGDLHCNAFSFDFLEIGDVDTLSKTIQSLIKQNKLGTASKLYYSAKEELNLRISSGKNVSEEELRDFENINLKLLSSTDKYIKQVQENGKVSKKEVSMIAPSLEESKLREDLLDLFDLNCMSDDEEKSYLTDIYGEKFTQSLLYQPSEFDIRMGLDIQEERKKEQEANMQIKDEILLPEKIEEIEEKL